MSSKDTDKKRIMHSKSDNIEIMINDKADEVIEEPIQSLLSSINGKDFTFACDYLWYYKCHSWLYF